MPDLYGGVAQLGEHLPCKQGVKSSNLSISIWDFKTRIPITYLENHILNKLNLKYLRYKTSEAYRKIRNRKNQVNTKTRGATLCTFV